MRGEKNSWCAGEVYLFSQESLHKILQSIAVNVSSYVDSLFFLFEELWCTKSLIPQDNVFSNACQEPFSNLHHFSLPNSLSVQEECYIVEAFTVGKSWPTEESAWHPKYDLKCQPLSTERLALTTG